MNVSKAKDIFGCSKASMEKNGILIGIKKTLLDSAKFIKNVYNKNVIVSVDEGCNVLKVVVPLKSGTNLFIIGCRMETGREKDLVKQYNAERKWFDKFLMPMIQPLEEGYKYIVSIGQWTIIRDDIKNNKPAIIWACEITLG